MCSSYPCGQQTPGEGQRAPPAWGDRVLCHLGTLLGGDRTGRWGQALGADPLPASPWGLVPLRGRTRSPGVCRAGGEGAWDIPQWPPTRSRGTRLLCLVPTASSRRFFSARWQSARPLLPLHQPFVSWCFWRRGFFRHSHSQMRLSHLPDSHPRTSPGAGAPSPTPCCLPGHCCLERVGPLRGCRQTGACEARGVVASLPRHGAFGDLGGVCFFQGRARGLRTRWRGAQRQP